METLFKEVLNNGLLQDVEVFLRIVTVMIHIRFAKKPEVFATFIPQFDKMFE